MIQMVTKVDKDGEPPAVVLQTAAGKCEVTMDSDTLERFKAQANDVLHDRQYVGMASSMADLLLQLVDEVERLRPDAQLGAMVRRMPVSWRLSHTDGEQWDAYRVDTMGHVILDAGAIGTTPEAALSAAFKESKIMSENGPSGMYWNALTNSYERVPTKDDWEK